MKISIAKRVMCVIGVACSFFSWTANADELTPEKRKNIEKLLMYSYMAGGGAGFVNQTSQQLFLVIQKQNPKIPTQPTTEIIREELAKALTDSDIPIYHKYLTDKEVKDVFAFYTSDTGMKFFAVYPSIINESTQLSPEAIKNINLRIKSKLESYGLLAKSTPTPAAAKDPFGELPKSASPKCEAEQRYKFNVKINSQQDFMNFLKQHLTKLKNKSDKEGVQLDNFQDVKSGTNIQTTSIDWKKVSQAITTEKKDKLTIYKLDYVPNKCGGQKTTIKATPDGHISVYGCCGK